MVMGGSGQSGAVSITTPSLSQRCARRALWPTAPSDSRRARNPFTVYTRVLKVVPYGPWLTPSGPFSEGLATTPSTKTHPSKKQCAHARTAVQ